jgi:hypothetical protein
MYKYYKVSSMIFCVPSLFVTYYHARLEEVHFIATADRKPESHCSLLFKETICRASPQQCSDHFGGAYLVCGSGSSKDMFMSDRFGS